MSTKKINSRAKGARGELESCKWQAKRWPEFFGDAERTAQHCGKSGDAADTRSKGYDLFKLHPEVKRVEKGNPYVWLKQAQRDARPSGRTPIVLHRRNNERWSIFMDGEDFFNLLIELQENKACS